MQMGAQEHREQKRVRLNETLSSNMSKRPVVKATSAHPSMIAPMMERLGSTVLLNPAPSNKDETTTGSLHAIGGTDVVSALVPEEEVWQFKVTKTCAERDSVSRRRTGISCDCEPRGSQCLLNHQRLRNKNG